MKNPIRSLALGIALFGAASAAMAQSSFLTYNQTASLSSNFSAGGNFTFQKFNQSLGTLTAVDLILNTATGSGSASITSTDATSASVTSLDMRVGTTSSVLSLINTTYVSVTTTPSLPTTLGAGATLTPSVASQSILSSAATYSIADLTSNFQSADGSGLTPVFSSRFGARFLGTFDPDFTPTTNFAGLAGSANYSLRYTYTPSGPVPVPEPGQVAASLLLLGGIGAYYFVKRRRKSAPAAA